jgi:shikimate dehydrogenase
MQNAGIQELGLDWRYLAFDVPPDNLAAALQGAKAMRFIGLNLTVPHKLLALPLMDALDESALAWGAVNTARFETLLENGEWASLGSVPAGAGKQIRSRGFNTDADAIIRAIEEDLRMSLPGARTLLLGAGGAGRTAALRLAAEGVECLWLVNRTGSKAKELQDEIAGRFPGVATRLGYPDGKVDLVVNATSLGLRETDPLPLDTKAFPLAKAARVYDMIYRPAETPLLHLARAEGLDAANGLGMLLYQGAKALEIWSGQAAPVSAMRRALEENIYGKPARAPSQPREELR